MEQREYIVEAEGAGQRIDRFLSGEDTGLSVTARDRISAEIRDLYKGPSHEPILSLIPI